MNLSVILYKGLIDPLLAGLRRSVKKQIHAGSTCLDIACGTGSMVFFLKDQCTSVQGIDTDEAKIRAAQKTVDLKGLDHLQFGLKDATNMADFTDGQFDYAHVAMALHQFDPDLREPIIREALRVGKTLLVADYSCPMPNNPAGWLAWFIEFLAGTRHFSNFRNYQKNGGMPELLKQMNLDYTCTNSKGYRVFQVFRITGSINSKPE